MWVKLFLSILIFNESYEGLFKANFTKLSNKSYLFLSTFSKIEA
jgi:glutathionyl-hydroquinone reductase